MKQTEQLPQQTVKPIIYSHIPNQQNPGETLSMWGVGYCTTSDAWKKQFEFERLHYNISVRMEDGWKLDWTRYYCDTIAANSETGDVEETQLL